MVPISAASLASAARAASESGTRAQSISAATLEARQSLARSPASPSDTSIAEEAGDGVARLRHEIAARQMLVLLAREAPAFGFAGIVPQQQPERGVADGAGDHHAVARLGASAPHHLAVGHG